MILSFINICNVPREMLKTSGFALGFQHLPRDIANVNEWERMFDPYITEIIIIKKSPCGVMLILCLFSVH